MKFLDKYRLYRSIMKQKPTCVLVHNNAIMLYNTDSYKVNICSIKKSDFIYIKPRFFRTKYFAYVSNKNGEQNTEFKKLFARKLFNHGKKYSK